MQQEQDTGKEEDGIMAHAQRQVMDTASSWPVIRKKNWHWSESIGEHQSKFQPAYRKLRINTFGLKLAINISINKEERRSKTNI